MPLIDITPPPGVIKPGTVYDAKGRWYDTLMVRWFEGVMQAQGGFEAVQVSGTQVDAGERVSGTHAWTNNAGAPLLAWGGPTLIKVLKGGTIFDVTPTSGFTTGSADAVITTGNYGNGNYGEGLYGVGDSVISDLQEAQSYQMDNYGEDLFFVAQSDGQIWFMDEDGNGGDPAAAVVITPSTGSVPTGNVGVVVTPERFVMALGAGSDGRKIQWPDVDDYTDWLATATNQAGDINLPGKGSIMAGLRAQAETLVWTDQDLFSLRYIGGNFVYQATPVGAVGAISRRSMAVVGSVAYWMSPRGFHIYNGFTQAIDSPLADYVFSDINLNQISKVWAEVRSEFGEVTWHYPSGTSTECDRSVTYNYNDGFWFNNTISRSAGEDRGALDYPVAFHPDGPLWRHETGDFYGNVSPASGGAGSTSTEAGTGIITGATDFSEFDTGAGVPTGMTLEADTPGNATVSVGNDATEGNYLQVVLSNYADLQITYDAWDGLITDQQNSSFELLARIYIDDTPNQRTHSGPVAFAGGTGAGIDGLMAALFARSGSDYESRIGEYIDGSFGSFATADIQEAEATATWYWIRARVVDNGATDNFYVKIWSGSLASEPASWDASNVGIQKRDFANYGSKIGYGINTFAELNVNHRIAYLAFTYAPDGEAITDPPEDLLPTVAAVPVLPEATSGPIEIGKGDNVMHVQSIIPDEKSLGDVDLYLLSSFYPTADETENGPYTPSNPTDVRITARQVRLKVVQDQSNWRVGTIRADVELGGER